MNKLTKKCLREGVYISPEIKSVEFKAEGMLCTSGIATLMFERADYNYGFNDLGEIGLNN